MNSAIAAVVTWNLADEARRPGVRQPRSAIAALRKATGLEEQMKTFKLWDDWLAGRRGRAN